MASDADKHLQSNPPQLLHGLRKVPDLAAAEVAVSRLPCARLAAVQRLGEGEVDAACLQGVGGFRQQGRAVTGAVAGGASRPERRLGTGGAGAACKDKTQWGHAPVCPG